MPPFIHVVLEQLEDPISWCVGFQVGGSDCGCRHIKEKTESFLNVFCDFIVKTRYIVCFVKL